LIFDFTKSDSDKLQNFSLLDPSDFSLIEKSLEGFDSKPIFVFPYPSRYGGSESDHVLESNDKKDSMLSFDITKMSAKEAEKQF
jgi:hypothetical protein